MQKENEGSTFRYSQKIQEGAHSTAEIRWVCIWLENTRGKRESSRPCTSLSLPTPPLLILPILHFHYYASASGIIASLVTPCAFTSRLLHVHETLSSSWTGKGRHPLFILIPHKTHTAFYWACQCNQKWCYTTSKNNYQALMIIQDGFLCVFSLRLHSKSHKTEFNFFCLLWAFEISHK